MILSLNLWKTLSSEAIFLVVVDGGGVEVVMLLYYNIFISKIVTFKWKSPFFSDREKDENNTVHYISRQVCLYL